MAKVLTMSEIAALANVAAGTERKIVTPHTQHAIYNPFFRRYEDVTICSVVIKETEAGKSSVWVCGYDNENSFDYYRTYAGMNAIDKRFVVDLIKANI